MDTTPAAATAARLRTTARRLLSSDDGVRRLCLAALLGWGLLATAVLEAGGSGAPVLWLTAPFLLLGVGLGLMLAGFWRTGAGYRIAVVLGGGLAAATAISQLLVLADAFDPVAVAGIETGIIALLWAETERALWKTRS